MTSVLQYFFMSLIFLLDLFISLLEFVFYNETSVFLCGVQVEDNNGEYIFNTTTFFNKQENLQENSSLKVDTDYIFLAWYFTVFKGGVAK